MRECLGIKLCRASLNLTTKHGEGISGCLDKMQLRLFGGNGDADGTSGNKSHANARISGHLYKLRANYDGSDNSKEIGAQK